MGLIGRYGLHIGELLCSPGVIQVKHDFVTELMHLRNKQQTTNMKFPSEVLRWNITQRYSERHYDMNIKLEYHIESITNKPLGSGQSSYIHSTYTTRSHTHLYNQPALNIIHTSLYHTHNQTHTKKLHTTHISAISRTHIINKGEVDSLEVYHTKFVQA